MISLSFDGFSAINIVRYDVNFLLNERLIKNIVQVFSAKWQTEAKN